MHTMKITPNLLFEYQCTSGKFIRLPNRIESKKLFCPNWNALATATRESLQFARPSKTSSTSRAFQFGQKKFRFHSIRFGNLINLPLVH